VWRQAFPELPPPRASVAVLQVPCLSPTPRLAAHSAETRTPSQLFGSPRCMSDTLVDGVAYFDKGLSFSPTDSYEKLIPPFGPYPLSTTPEAVVDVPSPGPQSHAHEPELLAPSHSTTTTTTSHHKLYTSGTIPLAINTKPPNYQNLPGQHSRKWPTAAITLSRPHWSPTISTYVSSAWKPSMRSTKHG